MSGLHCLRCKTALLTEIGPTDPRIAFFECPACRRQFARKSGHGLTFRWPHPIGLALYAVQFDEAPAGRAAEVADSIRGSRSEEEIALFAREIGLELDEPTHQVRTLLDCRASESELRRFLRLVVEYLQT